MLFHAGMAAACAGDPASARAPCRRPGLNPAFSVRWAPVAAASSRGSRREARPRRARRWPPCSSAGPPSRRRTRWATSRSTATCASRPAAARLYLRQVVDMAEIPTFRERSAIEDAGGLDAYAAARARERAAEIELEVDGRRVAVAPVSQTAEVRPGQGGLEVLRYAAWYRAPGAAPMRRDHGVDVRVPTYRDRLGWHELVVRPSSGAGVAGSTRPAGRLRRAALVPGGPAPEPHHPDRGELRLEPGHGGAVGPLTADPRAGSRRRARRPGRPGRRRPLGRRRPARAGAGHGLGRPALPFARPRQDDGGRLPGRGARDRAARVPARALRHRHAHDRGGRSAS